MKKRSETRHIENDCQDGENLQKSKTHQGQRPISFLNATLRNNLKITSVALKQERL